MNGKIYAVDEIRDIAAPLAKKYGVNALYLFGSYARGSANASASASSIAIILFFISVQLL